MNFRRLAPTILNIFIFLGLLCWFIKPAMAAEQTQNYYSGPVSSIGSFVSNIWNYNSQSISYIRELIGSVLSKGDQATSSSSDPTSIVKADEINEIQKIITTTRPSLEQLASKPIVKQLNNQSSSADLSDKISKTQNIADSLYGSLQNLKSRSLILEKKWSTLNQKEIQSELTTLSNIFKQDVSGGDTNIIAYSGWLKTSWNNPILLNLSDQALAAQSQINNLINDISLYNSAKVDTFKPALGHIQKLDGLVGSSLATSSDLNLFGFIKKTTEQVALLDKQIQEADKILAEYKSDPSVDRTQSIDKLAAQVISSSLVPRVDQFPFPTTSSKIITPVNKILSLKALSDAGKRLLTTNNGQVITTIWLAEVNTIHTLVVNPNQTPQTASLKFALPPELKMEQIKNHDRGLNIVFDSTEDALVVSGEISLNTLETRSLTIETDNIWNLNQEDIDNLKNQADELLGYLGNTSYFSQAISIKNQLGALDEVLLKQKQSVTPEEKIVTFREISIEINQVEEKINSLRSLALNAQNSGDVLGYASGIHPLTLWGIIAVIIACLIFGVIYISALRSEFKLNRAGVLPPPESPTLNHARPRYHHREKSNHRARKFTKIITFALIFGGLGSLGTSLILTYGSQVPLSQITAPKPQKVLGSSTEKSYPYESRLRLPNSGYITVHTAPLLTSPQVTLLTDTSTVLVFKSIDHWVQIGLSNDDQSKNWWISDIYLEK